MNIVLGRHTLDHSNRIGGLLVRLRLPMGILGVERRGALCRSGGSLIRSDTRVLRLDADLSVSVPKLHVARMVSVRRPEVSGHGYCHGSRVHGSAVGTSKEPGISLIWTKSISCQHAGGIVGHHIDILAETFACFLTMLGYVGINKLYEKNIRRISPV